MNNKELNHLEIGVAKWEEISKDPYSARCITVKGVVKNFIKIDDNLSEYPELFDIVSQMDFEDKECNSDKTKFNVKFNNQNYYLMVFKIVDDIMTLFIKEQEYNSYKSIISKIAYEVRTPLNTIFGMLDILDTVPMSSDQINLFNIIQDATVNVMEMMNDLVDYNKLLNGEMTPIIEELDIIETIDETINISKMFSEKKGVFINFEKHNNTQIYFSDYMRLKQIFVNIIQFCSEAIHI